jgi:endonuclease III-like uncharacterized protein
MKNLLINALALQLEYNNKLYNHTNVTFSHTNDEMQIVITPNIFGSFNGVDEVYKMFHDMLATHCKFEGGCMVITVF